MSFKILLINKKLKLGTTKNVDQQNVHLEFCWSTKFRPHILLINKMCNFTINSFPLSRWGFLVALSSRPLPVSAKITPLSNFEKRKKVKSLTSLHWGNQSFLLWGVSTATTRWIAHSFPSMEQPLHNPKRFDEALIPSSPRTLSHVYIQTRMNMSATGDACVHVLSKGTACLPVKYSKNVWFLAKTDPITLAQ